MDYFDSRPGRATYLNRVTHYRAREVCLGCLTYLRLVRLTTGMTTTDAPNRGQQLQAIMADLDRTGDAWVAAGYPFDGPEADAREAVFARLREWNEAQA